MDPITAIQGLLSMFGINAGGAAATTGATTTLAPAAGSGLGATAAGGTQGLTAQMGTGLNLFAPAGTQAIAGEAALAGAPATATTVAQPAMTDIAIKMGGFEGLKKAGTSLMDPNMSLHDKFNATAPELYKQNQQGQASFAQLQQGAQPMQMPSYVKPSMPYQGGGIQEILQRQRGLLR